MSTARATPTAATALARRQAKLLLLGAALVAVVVAALWFARARGELAAAYAAVASEQRGLDELHRRQHEQGLRGELAAAAAGLVERARASGLDPAGWGERRINIRQAQLPRQAVNELLATTARGDGRLFGAEAFELSVTRSDDGLFDAPGPQSQPVALTLRGTLLFKTQEDHP